MLKFNVEGLKSISESAFSMMEGDIYSFIYLFCARNNFRSNLRDVIYKRFLNETVHL